jgi:hypothetical protein
MGCGRHFREALRTDFRQMQTFDQRMFRTGFGAKAPAPAGTDYRDFDGLHASSRCHARPMAGSQATLRRDGRFCK